MQSGVVRLEHVNLNSSPEGADDTMRFFTREMPFRLDPDMEERVARKGVFWFNLSPDSQIHVPLRESRPQDLHSRDSEICVAVPAPGPTGVFVWLPNAVRFRLVRGEEFSLRGLRLGAHRPSFLRA